MTDANGYYIVPWGCRADAIIRHPTLGRCTALLAYIFELARANPPERVTVRADSAEASVQPETKLPPPLVADEDDPQEEEEATKTKLAQVVDSLEYLHRRLDALEARAANQKAAQARAEAAMKLAERDPEAALAALPSIQKREIVSDDDLPPEVPMRLN
jgi:hypothetical protein